MLRAAAGIIMGNMVCDRDEEYGENNRHEVLESNEGQSEAAKRMEIAPVEIEKYGASATKYEPTNKKSQYCGACFGCLITSLLLALVCVLSIIAFTMVKIHEDFRKIDVPDFDGMATSGIMASLGKSYGPAHMILGDNAASTMMDMAFMASLASDDSLAETLAEVISMMNPVEFIGALNSLAEKMESVFDTHSDLGDEQTNVQKVESYVHYWSTIVKEITVPWKQIKWPDQGDPDTVTGKIADQMMDIATSQLDASKIAHLGEVCTDLVTAIEDAALDQNFEVTGPGTNDADLMVEGTWAWPMYLTGVEECAVDSSSEPSTIMCRGGDIQSEKDNFMAEGAFDYVKMICANIGRM